MQNNGQNTRQFLKSWHNYLPKSHKELKQSSEEFYESNPTLVVANATLNTAKIPYPDDPGHSFTQWLNTGIRKGYVELVEHKGMYARATRISVLTPDYYMVHFIGWDNVEQRTIVPRVRGIYVYENWEVR